MGCYHHLCNVLQAFLPIVRDSNDHTLNGRQTEYKHTKETTIIIKVLFVHIYTLGSKLGKEILRRNSVALCFLALVGPRRLIIVIVGKYMRDLRRKVWSPHSDAISLSGWSRGPCFLRPTVGPRRLVIVIVGKYMRDLRRKVWCPHSDTICALSLPISSAHQLIFNFPWTNMCWSESEANFD